jgi:hypothetical protein
MKTLKFVSIFLLFIALAFPLRSQDNSVAPQRTPEQEAAKQTEKLQQELSLTAEQTRQVYDVNLRYARERQISNTRSEAVERMKNKNADIQRVLTSEQSERLQSKRYERATVDVQTTNRTQQVVVPPSGYRSSGEYRTGSTTVRVPATEMSTRSTYRQSGSAAPSQTQQPQTVRRGGQSATSQPGSTQQSVSAPAAVRSVQPSQSATRSTSSPAPATSAPVQRRSETSTSSPRR